MHIAMDMTDTQSGRCVEVRQTDLEFVGDVAELFLTFLNACGYDYVKQVVIIKDSGEEVSTM